MSDLDRSLFLLLNSDGHPSGLVLAIAIACAKYLILLVPLHIVLVWVAGDRGMRFVALSAVLALLLAIGINQAIGLAAYRPRPFLVGLGHALIEHRDSSSMPSNHATVCFTYAAVLALFARYGLAVVFVAIGLVTSWARIFLGIHYPLDMAVAAVVSIGSAVAMTWAMSHVGTGPLDRLERFYEGTLGRVWPGARRSR